MKKTISEILLILTMVLLVVFGHGKTVLADSETEFETDESETEAYEVPTYDTVVLSGVPELRQENDYYCGPACVKAVVHYHNHFSYSQSTYANQLGTNTTLNTYIGDIPGVINNAIGSSHYAFFNNASATYSNWIGQIKTAIDNGYPVIMLIKPTTGNQGGFDYTVSSGHFIVIIGYEYYTPTGALSAVKIMDPHYTYHQVFWNLNLSGLYSVNMAHPYHGMVR